MVGTPKGLLLIITVLHHGMGKDMVILKQDI